MEILNKIGVVIQYRDFLKKKYEVHGFLCRAKNFSQPTTGQEDEVGKTYKWMKKEEAIKLLENRILEIENNKTDDDSYQGKLFNTKTALTFLLNVD